jgi:hypothetical protein
MISRLTNADPKPVTLPAMFPRTIRLRGCIGAGCLYLLVCLAPLVAQAADISEPSNWTGGKIGWLASGTVELDEFEVDQENSFLFGFFSDFPMGKSFHYGVAMDLLRMDWSSDSTGARVDESELMLDLSLNVKGMLRLPGNRVAIRPGAGVGYGVMRRREALNGTNYLTLKAYTELVIAIGAERVIILDAGVWSSPTGGDSETSIKVGPLFFVRGGFSF